VTWYHIRWTWARRLWRWRFRFTYQLWYPWIVVPLIWAAAAFLWFGWPMISAWWTEWTQTFCILYLMYYDKVPMWWWC
jgi:hypothetical protein